MKIGGLLKFSMIDFPGYISAIVFTQGCNIRCKYCHNPELLSVSASTSYDEEEILYYLEKRKKCLEGLVITGGEPTLQPDLKDFIIKVRSFGYKIKLDTNGTNPQMVRELINEHLVDFIAMDIKAPFEKYHLVCGPVNTDKVKETMSLIINSGIAYQFRTTYYKEVLNDADIETIKSMCPDVSKFKLQECLPVAEIKPTLKLEHAI
ncbi:MAG: anaerobic ribonucleoside-triphosphate reductase activating protein [Elusimicrobiaceae bacterium]|nr:anaerobic ribonucleoside-triphosphate reductase activating protein [Elusimicrobiaceae bacterium]